MRPVNLIPPEERRGGKVPMRTGPLAYVVVAMLAVALVAVTLIVITGNQVSDREAEKASLESQLAEAQAAAARVQSFATFASVQQTREQTVSTLAQSRFDWERVLRELAILIPDDVWVTSLNASVSPDAVVNSSSASGSSSTSGSAESIAGPSLEIQGCAGGHEAVARFLAAVHDIDGVTRASVTSSERPDETAQTAASAGAASAGGAQSQECSSRSFVAKFDLTMAFDAVQLGATAGPSTTTPAPTTPATTTTTSTSTSAQPTASASTGEQSQVSGADQQLQQQKDSAAEKTNQGRNAVNTFIPGTGSGR